MEDIKILNELTRSNFIDPYVDVVCIKFLFNQKFNLSVLKNDNITPDVMKYVFDIFDAAPNIITYFQRTLEDNPERCKITKYVGIHIFNILKIIGERRPKFNENIHAKKIKTDIMKFVYNTAEIPEKFQTLTLKDTEKMLNTIADIIKTPSPEYNDIQRNSILHPYIDNINNLRITPLYPDIKRSLTQFMSRESILLHQITAMKENGTSVSELARIQISILKRMFNLLKEEGIDEIYVKELHGYIINISKTLKSLKK